MHDFTGPDRRDHAERPTDAELRISVEEGLEQAHNMDAAVIEV
jgi:hypothetical protein